jgi:macrocin-O-methyltransferase TylF-like protien
MSDVAFRDDNPFHPARTLHFLKQRYRSWRLHLARRQLVTKPTNPNFLEVLHDPAFRASVAETRDLTPADTAILANLWQLCRISGPDGTIVEVGAYKGGTALHLSNSRPDAPIIVCDTFEGYGPLSMDPWLDRREADWRAAHGSGPFEDTNAEGVRALFRARNRKAVILQGRFPASDADGIVADITFAHVDVTLYGSCKETLDYLAPRSRPGAIWVIDSYNRRTDGVNRAADEFVATHRDWVLFPVYPGQAAVFNRNRP